MDRRWAYNASLGGLSNGVKPRILSSMATDAEWSSLLLEFLSDEANLSSFAGDILHDYSTDASTFQNVRNPYSFDTPCPVLTTLLLVPVPRGRLKLCVTRRG